jgi:hypothetical protein
MQSSQVSQAKALRAPKLLTLHLVSLHVHLNLFANANAFGSSTNPKGWLKNKSNSHSPTSKRCLKACVLLAGFRGLLLLLGLALKEGCRRLVLTGNIGLVL